MAKVKFSLEAGSLLRPAIRRALNKLEADVKYQDPKAYIKLSESKGLLASDFTFVATDLKDDIAIAVDNFYRKLVKNYS